jgi:hypothetical protein
MWLLLRRLRLRLLLLRRKARLSCSLLAMVMAVLVGS